MITHTLLAVVTMPTIGLIVVYAHNIGNDFDARARAPLWKNGWDYNHGTGHGIGYYLSVHEGMDS